MATACSNTHSVGPARAATAYVADQGKKEKDYRVQCCVQQQA